MDAPVLAGFVGSALLGLEAVALVTHLRRRSVPRAYSAATPLAAGLVAASLLAYAPGLSLLYVLGLGVGLAVGRWLRGYNVASGVAGLTVATLLATYTSGVGLSPVQAVAVSLSAIGSGLAASAVLHDERRLLLPASILAAASLPILAYLVASASLLLFPSGGAATVAALAAVLASVSLDTGLWGLYASLAPAALGALASGYAPYLPSASTGMPLAAGLLVALVSLAVWARRYRSWRSPKTLLSILSALLLVAPLLVGLPSSDAATLETLGGFIAGAVAAGGVAWKERLARLALLYAGLALLLAPVVVPIQPLAVHCRIVDISLDGRAPAPAPSERIIHDFYLLYLGAKNETLVYALLEPRLGRSKALQMAQFCHAIRLAAEARGINDTYPIYALQHPQTLPVLTARTDCGVRLELSPLITLCPRGLEPGADVNVTGYASFLHPIHVMLDKPCELARDYLVLIGDPRLTGRDALRYAIYTSMLVSYGEGRNLTDTARLLFYYALNPKARVNATDVTIVYASRFHVVPLSALASVLFSAAAVAAYIHARKRP